MVSPNNNWQQVTPGGGGRLMWCSASPHDRNMMICCGDMGGVFRSEDRGENWVFCPAVEVERVCHCNGSSPWEYVIDRAGEIWTGSRTRGMLKSCDYGRSWKRIPGPWDQLKVLDWHHATGPEFVRFSTKDSSYAIAAWNRYGDNSEKRLYYSTDSGDSWNLLKSDISDTIKEIAFESESIAVAVCEKSFLRFDLSAGTTEFEQLKHKIAAACWSQDKVYMTVDKEPGMGLYCLNLCDYLVYKIDISLNSEYSWVTCVSACRTDSSTVYVGLKGNTELEGDSISTAVRSIDGGKTWQQVLFRNPEQKQFNISPDRWTTGLWGWQTPPWSLNVDYLDSSRVAFSDFTMCGISDNAGESWNIVSGKPVLNGLVPAGGPQMLTGWNYYIRSSDIHYAATTDFTGWMSPNGGADWKYCPPCNAPWHNNIYALAFIPNRPGLVFGAASLKHDLPYWHHMVSRESRPELWRGGVIVSEDGGESWNHLEPDKVGLPDLPTTDIYYDESGNTLYIAMVGGGVYKSNDLGNSWQEFNGGLSEKNYNALRLCVNHAGLLYLVVTTAWDAVTETVISGEIYRMAADAWEQIDLPQELVFPVDIEFSQNDTAMYVSCFQLWRELIRHGKGAYGMPGLWRLDKDGVNEMIYSGSPVYCTKFVPGSEKRMLLCTSDDGAHISDDGGVSWNRISDLPPGNIHSATFDPDNPTDVYLTTFGQGVWRGGID